MDHMHPDDRQFLLEQFAGIRGEMATKDDLIGMATKDDLADMATKSDIEELATYVQRGFTDLTMRLVRVEDSVDLLHGRDFQGQIDHLRDDMHLVKTKLGM